MTSVREDYLESKKKKNKEDNSSRITSVRDDYFASKIQSGEIDPEKIRGTIESSINAWLKRNEGYVSDFNKRFGKEASSYRADASDWLDAVTSQNSQFSQEAESIKNYANYYSSLFNEEWIKTINDALDQNLSVQNDIVSNSTKDKEYWSQWSDEIDYTRDISGWLAEDAETNADTVAGRQKVYEANKARIAEIDNILRQPVVKHSRDGIKAFLTKEKETLEAENRMYERTQGSLDSYYKPETEEFLANGAYRDYANPTIEDVEAYWNSLDDTPTAPADILGFYLNDYLPLLDGIESRQEDAQSRGEDYRTTIPAEYVGVYHEGVDSNWELLDDYERNLYYDLLKTEGSEAAYDFLKKMTPTLNKRALEEKTKDIADATGLEAVFMNVASVPMNILGGASAFVADVSSIIRGEEINPYGAGHDWQNTAQIVRDETAKDINNWTGNAALPYVGTTFGDVYQALMSGADSLVGGTLLGGTGYGIIMGMGAASSEAKELYERGASMGQIATGSILAGVAEMVFEKVSIDNFIKIKDAKTKVGIVLNALKQGGVEATEEMATEIANTITDTMVMGSQSDLEGYISQYMAEGATRGEATAKALLHNVTPEVLNAGIGGLISGGTMGSIGSVGGYLNTQNQYKQEGQNIIEQGGVDTLKALALEMSSDKSTVNAKQIGKAVAKVEAKETAKNIGKLSEQLKTSTAKQNTSDIQSALVEKGLSKQDAKRVTEYINKAMQGEKLSDSETSAMTSDEKITEALRDIVGDPTSKVNTRIRNLVAAQLGVDVKNAKIGAKTSGNVTLENDVLTEGKVSEDKQTVIASTGEAVTIDKGNAISKVETVDGETVIYYNTDKGEVAASDIQYASKDDVLLYEGFSDLPTAIANSAIKMYDGKSDIGAYIDGVREGIILYGKHNFQGVGKDISMNSSFAALSEVDQKHSLELGRSMAKAESEKAENALKTVLKQVEERAKENTTDGKKKARKGTVRFESGAKATTKEQKRAYSLAKHLASAVGIDIVFYDARNTHTQGGDANGYFDSKTDTMYLDLQKALSDSHTIAFTMSHELVHFIKKWSPAKFNTFANFLMEQYAEHGVSTSTLLANKMAALGTTDADLAYEELVADACERMLLDSNAMVKLAQLRAKDGELFDKIKAHILTLLNNIRNAMKGMPAREEAEALQKMDDVLSKFYEMFEDMAVDAAQNYQTIGTRNLADYADAKTTDGGELFQYKAMAADEKAYRTMLTKWGKMTDTQIDNLFDTIDTAMELIKDNLEILDYAWEADIDDRAFSPVKPNSDKLYQVSLDFSTLCRKRLLQQTVQAQLQEALNQPLTKEEGIAIRDALIALQEEGRQIEVACALCYVESARMKSPEQIKRFMDNKEAVIKEFFAGKSGGSMKEKLKQAEAAAKEKLHKENPNGIKGKDGTTMLDPRTAKLNQLPKKYADEIRTAKRLAKASYAPTAEEQRIIEVAKGMTVSDFASPEGLENLAKNYPSLFDAYTSYVRNATKSKGIESDTWWRAGDSERIGDVLIANMNRENGLRSQSWSDFQVIHILDYIAATIELATRNAKEQAYSKVPDYVELMGNTGVMINMSLIPTATFNGSLDYDSVEGIDYKKALELRDKYHATAGTICIGVDNVQIKLLLEDATIDYVIPFHRSGMSAHIRKAMHIPTWSEYQDYQGEGKLSRAEAESRAKKYGVTLLSESDPNYQKGTSFSEWFDLKEAQQIAKIENANPSDKAKHKKYGVMYGGYMAMQNAANNYLKLCAERGLAPKFSHEKADFTAEDNYWKLLIDRKMVDNVTGEVIEQQTIKPIFEESEIMRILNDELARYPKVKEDQDYALRTVTEKMLSGEIKGGMSAEAIAKAMKKPVDNVTNVNILASAENGADLGIKKQAKPSKKDPRYLDPRTVTEADVFEMLENVTYGVYDDGTYIPLRRNTPEFFIGVVKAHSKGTRFIEDYPIAATVEHLRQNMEEVDGLSYGQARPHEFSVDDVITMTKKMGDPSYIILQKNNRYAEVVSFYNGRNKRVIVSIDFADGKTNPKKQHNYKHPRYMNGYEGGYYNIVVTQYEPDDFRKYLNDNEVVYDKKEMNGKYQVGSGRIVTVTHDTPFIEDIVPQVPDSVKREFSELSETLGNIVEEVGAENVAEVAEQFADVENTTRIKKQKKTTSDNTYENIGKELMYYEEGDLAPDLTLVETINDRTGNKEVTIKHHGQKPKGYIPRKVAYCYKLFEQHPDGSLHALFAGAKSAVPIGEWRYAQGFPRTDEGVKGMNLRERYGWHLSAGLPSAPHLMSSKYFERGYPSKGAYGHPKGSKRVWVRMAYDASTDFNSIADSTGKQNDIYGLIPFGGYYAFKENNQSEWVISSAVKIDKILTEEERQQILKDAGYDEHEAWRLKYQPTPEERAARELANKERAKAKARAKKLGIDSELSESTKAMRDSIKSRIVDNPELNGIKKQVKRTASYAPTFYSQMGKVIDDIKMDKIGAASIVNYLKGKGIRHDEIKWSGIEAFLEGKKSVTKAELQEFVAGSQLIIEEEMGSGEEETRWDQYKLDGGSNYRELVFKMPNSSYSNGAMRGHWGQDAEGVLVHARIQDFDVNGKKMLFIEELQSDWHNEGMEKGYTTEEYEDAVATYDRLAEDYANKRRAFNKYVRSAEFRSDPDDVSKKKFDWLRGKTETAEKRMQEADRYIDSLKEKGMGDVADAPFRDTYHEYVLKRLLRMATEEGYDSLGWTPAYIQSERWSEDYAEAYRIEYDQDMPSFLRKYGKKWGATVGKSEVTVAEHSVNGEHYDAENIEVWSMDITDSMQESVLYDGQPMFQKKTVSNRTLLANALESAAQTDIERNKLTQYKGKIDLIESEQAKLAEVKAKANELRFTKGRTPEETKRMRALDFEATQISNRINTYDRQLLNLESTAALKNVLQREKEMVRKKTEQKGKEALAAYKAKSAEAMRTLMERNAESRKKNIEGRHKTEMRHKIKKVVGDLKEMLFSESKDKHVPIGLQKPVAEALDIINMDTVGAEDRIAKLKVELMMAKTPEKIQEISRKIDYIQYQGNNLSDKLTALKQAYAEIKNSEDPLVKNSHNEAIEDLIAHAAEEVGNTSIRDMSYEQLETVYDMYKAILATVRNANKMFKADRQETITDNSELVKREVRAAGGHRNRVLKATKALKKFGWNMLKPIYAMKLIGSDKLTRLYENVRKGEDTWAVDVNEAKAFFQETKEKYNYTSWDFKKQYTFEDSAGHSFSLSLEQIMSLYAYSKRDQADKHLEDGGFIFDDSIEVKEAFKLGKINIPMKYEVNDANPYRLKKEDLGKVIGILDTDLKNVKGFVDEMQAYLSDVMGAKGNEVSLAMYDIKLYKEKNYFPLKTARYFREFDPEKNGTPKIKNSGFSKKTVPQAGNPIILSNFMDVWANHVNDMSMYHAFVLPLEDFMRVYNYSSTAGGYDSVQQYIKNAYGSQANTYIETLMNDLNGGARSDPATDLIGKGMSLFKKAAVFASASVVIQQPSAIARATAYIDPKYFVDMPEATKHSETWAEVKKYAPVAIIKEMGYFDTNMGRSTVDWIRDEKTWRDKIDNLASKAPALADELAWSAIWKAVKREVAATTNLKVGSEEFLKKAGERFTEVVTKTQVYDSVLSRSALMRSKDSGAKMVTAFMAEPTTSLNMVVDAIIEGKRGNKKFAGKVVGAVSASIILNSILVSLVTAARDDDEDETYAEKYLESLTAEILDGFNPLTYIPLVKDVWSIMQGYDIERSDMSVLSDLWQSVESLFSDNKSGFEKTEGIVGSIASMFGIPLKNLMRDARAMYNLATTLLSGTPTTRAGVEEAVGGAVKSSIPLYNRIEKWVGADDSKSDKLYDAIISGDQAHIGRVKAQYKDDKAIESAIRQGLRENDSRIHEAAQARLDGDIGEYTRIAKEIIAEGYFSQDTVVASINAEITAIKKGETSEEDQSVDTTENVNSIYKASDVNSAFESGDTETALEVIDDLIKTKVANGMTEKEAKSSIRSSMTSYWKPLYKEAYKNGDTEEMKRIRYILLDSGLYGKGNEVVKTAKGWIQEKD